MERKITICKENSAMVVYLCLQMTPNMSVDNIIHLLEQHYGPRRWKPGPTPLSVLIGTILSQNTSDVNSTRAFETLKGTFEIGRIVFEMPELMSEVQLLTCWY
jgi:endonuclease III